MRINKITTGFVIQTYDTVLKKWVGQEFVAGDPVEYEEAGTDRILDPAEIWPKDPEPYLPFEMKQPEEQHPIGPFQRPRHPEPAWRPGHLARRFSHRECDGRSK